MVQRQAAFAVQMYQHLYGTLADLERLQAGQVQPLELRLEEASGAGQAEPVRAAPPGDQTSV